MNTGATLVVNLGAAQTFEMPQGWTHRKVAAALAREWLEPFRPKVVSKSSRWIVQSVMEPPADGKPLWEPGISTEEYERRLERPDLTWAVRAKAGRPKGVILARLVLNPEWPNAFDMACSQDPMPETLVDPLKLAEFLETHGREGIEGLFTGLLLDHGFRMVSVQ